MIISYCKIWLDLLSYENIFNLNVFKGRFLIYNKIKTKIIILNKNKNKIILILLLRSAQKRIVLWVAGVTVGDRLCEWYDPLREELLSLIAYRRCSQRKG